MSRPGTGTGARLQGCVPGRPWQPLLPCPTVAPGDAGSVCPAGQPAARVPRGLRGNLGWARERQPLAIVTILCSRCHSPNGEVRTQDDEHIHLLTGTKDGPPPRPSPRAANASRHRGRWACPAVRTHGGRGRGHARKRRRPRRATQTSAGERVPGSGAVKSGSRLQTENAQHLCVRGRRARGHSPRLPAPGPRAGDREPRAGRSAEDPARIPGKHACFHKPSRQKRASLSFENIIPEI